MLANRIVQFLKNVLSTSVQFSASPRLLGRHSEGAGAGQEIALGAGLSFVGNTLTLSSGSGEGGAADHNKVVLYGSSGNLNATYSVSAIATLGFDVGSISLVADGSNLYLAANRSSGALGFRFFIPEAPSSLDWALPMAGGFLALASNDAGEIATSALLCSSTDDDAPAGKLGEYMAAERLPGAAIPLTTATGANVTSLELTPGDWDVEGHINVIESAATVVARAYALSTVSGDFDATENLVNSYPTTTANNGFSLVMPRRRISVMEATTTTVYAVVEVFFSAGTVTAHGAITARRVR